MERGRLLSLKRAIVQSDYTSFVKLVDELIAETEPLPLELVQALKVRLSGGAVTDSSTAGKLIVRTRSRDLYQVPSVRACVLDNVDVLIKLLKNGIPDLDIEKQLCERLISEFEKSNPVLRSSILEALRDHGSIRCLDTLELIEYSFHGKYKTAKLLSASTGNSVQPALPEEFISQIERKADTHVGALVKEAIVKIRERNSLGDDSWGNSPKPSPIFPLFDDYVRHAENGLARNDLGGPLNHVRKAVEHVLKSVIKMQGITPKSSDPIDQMQLPGLMGTVMDRGNRWTPDKWVYQLIESLQKQTTMGSHDQGVAVEVVATPEMVKGAISTAIQVRKYFEENVSRYADGSKP